MKKYNKLKGYAKNAIGSFLLAGALVFPFDSNAEERAKKLPSGNLEQVVDGNTDKKIIHLRQKHIPSTVFEDYKFVQEQEDSENNSTLNNLTGERISNEYSQEEMEKVNDYQRDIFHFLKQKENPIVYTERFSVDQKPSEEKLKMFFNGYHHALHAISAKENTSFEDYLKKHYFLPGADLALGYESDSIDVRGANISPEDMNGFYDKILTGDLNKEEIKDFILDYRENIALKKIFEDNVDEAHLLYGMDHDFSDNVIKYNKENPDNQYDLFEFNPASIEKYRKSFLEKWNEQNERAYGPSKQEENKSFAEKYPTLERIRREREDGGK